MQIMSINKNQREIIKQLTREFRKTQTEGEIKFWSMVRARKLFGLKFLRQHALIYEYYGRQKFFIADFYCSDKKLVVELDGKIHDRQKDYDQQRDYIMNTLGLRVLRIKNEELNDTNSLINKLNKFLET